MSIEFPGTLASGPPPPHEPHILEKNQQDAAQAVAKTSLNHEISKEEITTAMDTLVRAASIFSRRLQYSINEEIGRVVVKIIDAETDKVIKEIPPEELQRLIARLKETIGLLVDEKI